MIKKAKGLSLILVLTLGLWGIFIFPCSPQSTDKLTIVTYYPSPYGVYNELRSKRMAIGDSYYKNSDYCWGTSCTNTIDSDADLVVEGNVGIGTTTPGTNKLYVAGNTKIDGDLSVTGKIITGGGKSVQSFSTSKSDYASGWGTASVNCMVKIPDDFVVIYAYKGCTIDQPGCGGGSNSALQCAHIIGDPVCSETNIGDVGPTITAACSADSRPACSGAYAYCGIYAIGMKVN